MFYKFFLLMLILYFSCQIAKSNSDIETSEEKNIAEVQIQKKFSVFGLFMPLGKMIAMMTCRLSTSWAPFIHVMLANYGCYCGAGGEGKPVDGIDACCQAHDKCYDDFIKYAGCQQTPYIQTYSTDPLGCWCLGETPDWMFWYGNNKCDQQVCECDTNFVACLAGQPSPSKQMGCKPS